MNELISLSIKDVDKDKSVQDSILFKSRISGLQDRAYSKIKRPSIFAGDKNYWRKYEDATNL